MRASSLLFVAVIVGCGGSVATSTLNVRDAGTGGGTGSKLDSGTVVPDAGTSVIDSGVVIVVDGGVVIVVDGGVIADGGLGLADAGVVQMGVDAGSRLPCSGPLGGGCPAGEACYVTRLAGGETGFICLGQGTTQHGGPCALANDCAAGNVCLSGNPSKCYAYCVYPQKKESPKCPDKLQCDDFGIAGLGYCVPPH